MSTQSQSITIGTRVIGAGNPCYIIAELSANHCNDYAHAERTIRAMKDVGADAVKVQTYTADTLTLDCPHPSFVVGGGTLWDGKTLHELYQEASMPWEWQPRLQTVAHELEMEFFSSPFDDTAVDFLEQMNVPAYKVASPEIIDLPLLRRIARTGKPVIVSTGMASFEEIEEAIQTLRSADSGPIALLKCTSAYPAAPEEMNLRTIPDMAARLGLPVGLSDHTMGHVVPVTAVALGACIVEKHFTLSRKMPGPDSAFSMEPEEFRTMVNAIRTAEAAIGHAAYQVSAKEVATRRFRRSLFAVEDIVLGEKFTKQNVRSIRPAIGLHPRQLEEVLQCTATKNISRGTPLAQAHLNHQPG